MTTGITDIVGMMVGTREGMTMTGIGIIATEVGRMIKTTMMISVAHD